MNVALFFHYIIAAAMLTALPILLVGVIALLRD